VHGLIEVLAGVLAVLCGAAALVGGWAWWQVRPARAFWVVLRASQVAAVVLAGVAGIAAAGGHRPDDGLFWVYALVPLAVGFVAEQLRIVSAETVLQAQGLESAQDVGSLPDAQQRSIIVAIVRRETGVMAMAAAVICFLALRAMATATGL